MRRPTGLICAAAMLAVLSVGTAWAQGEMQAPAAAPSTSPSLNTMPRWSEFPVPPTDVPTAADIKQRVDAQIDARDLLRSQFKALPWDKFEPEALAAAIHAQVDPAMLTPVDPPLSADQLESMGAALRAKAAPPPVAN